MAEKKPPNKVRKLIDDAEKRKAAKAAKPLPKVAKQMHLRGGKPRPAAPTHVLSLIAKHIKKGKP